MGNGRDSGCSQSRKLNNTDQRGKSNDIKDTGNVKSA